MSPTKKTASKKGKSMCRGKRTTPNKCGRVSGCKVAHGTKRTFCRKKKSTSTKRRHTNKRASASMGLARLFR